MEVSDVKIPWHAKSRRYFHFTLQQSDDETRVIFLSWGKLEKIKQNERDRLPAYVTDVGMPMAKNIEGTSCLDPQRRMSSSIATLSFIGFKNNESDWKKNYPAKASMFFGSWVFFAHETRAEVNRCPHMLKKHLVTYWVTCLWARHNSNKSMIFSDFKSDLSRVIRFPNAGQVERRLLGWGC